MSKTKDIPTSELEKSLLGYKQKCQSLADNSNVAIATTDKRGRFTYVNNTLTELLGYSTQELLGTEFKNYLHPDDRGQIIALFLNIMVLKRQPRNIEFRALRKDGTILNLISKPSKLVIEGKTIGFLSIMLDITTQKRTEEELRESESNHKDTSDFLSNILSNMLDYVFIIDEDHTIIYLNESAKKVYGNLIGQKCYKATRNLDQPCYNSGIDCEVLEVIHKGNNVFEDIRKMDLCGRIVHVRAKPIQTSEKKRAIIIVVRDVTEEKQSKEELGKSLSLLRTTFESTADGILVADLNKKITNYNQKFIEILKIPKHLMKSKDDNTIIEYLKNKMKDPEGFVKRIEESFSKPEIESLDLLDFKDGRMIERYSRPQHLEGIIIGRVMSFRDITDRIRAENELRENKEFNSSLLEHSAYPIMVANPDTSLRYVNPALEELTGFSLSEIIGKKAPYPWWPNDKKDGMKRNLIKHMNHGAKDDEDCFQKKSGKIFWVEVNGTPVTKDDELKYYLSNWVDITDHKRMEEELKQYSAHLGELVNKKTNELAKSNLFLRSTIDVVPDLM
jgi:PAS domain S-box-containing protein